MVRSTGFAIRADSDGVPFDGRSGHRSRVEQDQGVVKPEPVGRDLLSSARDVENQVEQLPPDIGDARLAGRYASRVEIDEVFPSVAQRRVG